MGQEAEARTGLFASVLHVRAHQAERRARLLWLVPFILALHIVAGVFLSPERRESVRLPARAGVDDAPTLHLLAAPPILPSAQAPTAAPARAAPQRVAARKVFLRPKPAPRPTRAPEAEESPPPDTAEAAGGAISTDVAQDSMEENSIGEVVGGLLYGVLAGGAPVPPTLASEEREASVERYVETLIRERFMHVRYPHLAAAAGISGQVMLRMTVSPEGRLLTLELVGRCPHPVLCDAALETARNAQPFPPPPPELGKPLLLDLPFRYHLQ